MYSTSILACILSKLYFIAHCLHALFHSTNFYVVKFVKAILCGYISDVFSKVLSNFCFYLFKTVLLFDLKNRETNQ